MTTAYESIIYLYLASRGGQYIGAETQAESEVDK